MTIKQAITKLESLGFQFLPENGRWGTIEAEPYTNDLIKNNHWSVKYRSVYISSLNHRVTGDNFYYITSSIHGKYRRNRARKYNEWNREFANIFVSGKTLEETINKFLEDFETKRYNEYNNIYYDFDTRGRISI